MTQEMQIDVALANLEAGKFSFRTADAIRTHIEKLERELATARDSELDLGRKLQLREYANARLEAELRKSNATIHALLRANKLTETACTYTAVLAEEAKKSLEAFAQYAAQSSKRAAILLSDEKFWLGMRQRAERAGEKIAAAVRDLQASDVWQGRHRGMQVNWGLDDVKKFVAKLQAR
jgi:hypothetical protein